jgi:hypothetical protein
MTKGKYCTFHNAQNKQAYFQELLMITLENSVLLKIDNDILCAIESFNHAIQQAVWNATPMCGNLDIDIEYSSAIKDKVTEKKQVVAN